MIKTKSVKYDLDTQNDFYRRSLSDMKTTYGETITARPPALKFDLSRRSRNTTDDPRQFLRTINNNNRISIEAGNPDETHQSNLNLSIKKTMSKSVSNPLLFPKAQGDNLIKLSKSQRSVLNRGKPGETNFNLISMSTLKQTFRVDREDLNNLGLIKEKKQVFLKKQREYLLQKTEYKAKRIILPSMYKSKNTAVGLDDVFKRNNDLNDEPEYVKKFLIPPSDELNQKSKSNDFPRAVVMRDKFENRTKKVILNSLLPKGQSTDNKGYRIQIQQRGSEFIYQIVKDKEEKKSSLKKTGSSFFKQGREFETLNQPRVSVRTYADSVSPTKSKISKRKSQDIPLLTSSITHYFRDKKIRVSNYNRMKELELDQTIKGEIERLDEIKKSIQTTLDLAVNSLIPKEHLAEVNVL